MDNKLPVKRLIICALIAVVAIVLGYYNIFSDNYGKINDVLQLLITTVGMTAIGELFASLSRFPIISYIISAVMCAIMFQIITPFSIFMVAGYDDLRRLFSVYHESAEQYLVLYSAALTVSVLFGIFVLHRKDIFKPED